MWWAPFWFLLSAAFVDLAGYWLHRWAHSPRSPLYRAHMTHHVTNYPPKAFFSDRYISSGLDTLALWFAPFALAYVVLILVLGVPHPLATVLGGAFVAVGSSVFHDRTHIRGSLVWRRPLIGLAQHHRTHHSKMGRNFGILTTVWDRIFGTRHPGRTTRLAPLP